MTACIDQLQRNAGLFCLILFTLLIVIFYICRPYLKSKFDGMPSSYPRKFLEFFAQDKFTECLAAAILISIIVFGVYIFWADRNQDVINKAFIAIIGLSVVGVQALKELLKYKATTTLSDDSAEELERRRRIEANYDFLIIISTFLIAVFTLFFVF